MRISARPQVYACAHLANSASLLLPVSNLTNLLALQASGLSFTRFAALMVLPVIAASRVASSMRATILLGMAIGLGSVLAGITVAYYADLPPGGTTVLVAAATVLVAEAWSANRGR